MKLFKQISDLVFNKAGVPIKQALVQRQGLSPDDTFWGNWDELQSTYNLGDKVAFDGGGIDKVIENGVAQSVNEEVQQERPKRIVKQKCGSEYVYYWHKGIEDSRQGMLELVVWGWAVRIRHMAYACSYICL